MRETETSFLDDSPAQQRVNGLRSVLGADGVREITVSRTPSAGREVIDALRAFAAPDAAGEHDASGGGGGDGAAWRPTAVFAHRDLVAISVLGAAREAGLHVPGELSIVGYDDDDVTAALDLSTVANPLRVMAGKKIKKQQEAAGHEGRLDMVKFADIQTSQLFIDKSLAAVPVGVTDDDIDAAIGASVTLSVNVLDGKAKTIDMRGE